MSFLNSLDLWVGWSPFSPFGPGNVKPFSKYRLVCCEGGLSNENTDHIWVNYNISWTWLKAIWGWFPLLTMIPVRSQWGRYNLPRSYVIVWYTRYIQIKLQKPFSRPLHPRFGMKSMGPEAGAWEQNLMTLQFCTGSPAKCWMFLTSFVTSPEKMSQSVRQVSTHWQRVVEKELRSQAVVVPFVISAPCCDKEIRNTPVDCQTARVSKLDVKAAYFEALGGCPAPRG